MDIAELDMQSSAELLPDRQALGTWSSWSGGHGGGQYVNYTSFSYHLSVSVSYTHFTSYSW